MGWMGWRREKPRKPNQRKGESANAPKKQIGKRTLLPSGLLEFPSLIQELLLGAPSAPFFALRCEINDPPIDPRLKLPKPLWKFTNRLKSLT